MTVCIQQRGLYFEEVDLHVVCRRSPGPTAEAVLFSTPTMNPPELASGRSGVDPGCDR